jgi:vacuolar protein sorting-associated protein 11
MFPLAIELAQKSGMDNEQQSLIYRRFGDHLYQKADYDGAMVQYIRAINTTEPSQVIRKVSSLSVCRNKTDVPSTSIHSAFTT